MANRDAPLGFQPYRHLGGGVIRASGAYKISSAYAVSLYRGDAVVLTSGFLAIGAENSATFVGVFAGCQYRTADGETKWSPYWPASTVTLNSEAAQAFVYDDPMISYKVQCDTGTAYVDATHKATSVDIELDHAGSTITGLSGMEIDLADTGTGQIKIIGLIDEPENAAGVNAKVEVLIDTAFLKA
jgi:hypothetical protein